MATLITAPDDFGSTLNDDAFERLMRQLEPFEPAPRLAVAVSGGADSTALVVLTQHWVRSRGGSVVALIVDHGLRIDSSTEASAVAHRLAGLTIDSTVLSWTGAKPTTGVQAAARHARYRLLGDWCRQHAVPHLLIGHHAADVAETVLMRLCHGSDVDGLAAMRAVIYTDWGRILRPLLPMAPDVLRATLKAAGVGWVSDPSNHDLRFERVRWRQAAPTLAAHGLGQNRLTDMARQAADIVDALDAEIARMLASTCHLDARGFAEISVAGLATQPSPIGARILQRMLAVIGGMPRRPSLRRVAPLLSLIDPPRQPGSATLGRVLLASNGETLTLCRERRHLPVAQLINPGTICHWDGRFKVSIAPSTICSIRLWLRPLGEDGWRTLIGADHVNRKEWQGLPVAVPLTLPVIGDAAGIACAPLLGYRRPDALLPDVEMAFRPLLPATLGAYYLA